MQLEMNKLEIIPHFCYMYHWLAICHCTRYICEHNYKFLSISLYTFVGSWSHRGGWCCARRQNCCWIFSSLKHCLDCSRLGWLWNSSETWVCHLVLTLDVIKQNSNFVINLWSPEMFKSYWSLRWLCRIGTERSYISIFSNFWAQLQIARYSLLFVYRFLNQGLLHNCMSLGCFSYNLQEYSWIIY